MSRLAADLDAPNGIILSPDEKTLYVVPSQQKQVMAYDITAPGKLSNARVLFELKQKKDRLLGDYRLCR
ncbi:MAG: SMP-30/gluconolactonase/LRE family protein [Planctomycetaceae bacterium]|nr:SMP-30/gluconolactonase/LRE family protein [Planctomycetaceae bacterium]